MSPRAHAPDLHAILASLESEARQLLCDLISIPSLPGREAPAIERMHNWFASSGVHTRLLPIPDDIRDDEDYSFGDEPFDYSNRCNLVAELHGSGNGHSIILSSHVDVVPAQDWSEAFAPRTDGERIYGRGACDAKGQVVTIALVLKALRMLGVELSGSVTAHVVVEEEPGGNGALSLIRGGQRADAALVLEGTELQIHPANRGAIWFRLSIEGKSIHMGRRHEGINAIEKMMPLISALQRYEETLIAESKGQQLFGRYEHPVQVNFGTLHAGRWPSMVAGEAVMEGGVGFLPNKRMSTIKEDLRRTIESAADNWTREHYKLEFCKLHNDAYASDPDHPFVHALQTAARECGAASNVYGWNVSCDARLYFHRGGMPTVVFGPGSISVAHSNNEFIEMSEILTAAEIIALAVMDWCNG